jgi:hypothetical protein
MAAPRHLLPEQQNFTCLSLASTDKVREILSDVLHSQIQPKDLYQKIQSNSKLMNGNEKEKLSPEQLSLCNIPSPRAPDYSDFDITLLYKLLRNLCPTLKPTKKWGQKPNSTDENIGDDIERLRFLRNDLLAHTKSYSVPENAFKSTWSMLEDIFKRMQKFFASKGMTKKYVEHLEAIKDTNFGKLDYEKYMHEMRLMLEIMKVKDVPKLTLQGDEKTICGESACFVASYDDGEMSNNWPITWQRIRGHTIESLDIGAEKYRGSSSQRLVIPRVSKEDQGEYQATVSREFGGTRMQIPSNTIYLTVTGGNTC